MTRRLDNLAREICKLKYDYTCQKCGYQSNGQEIQWAHIEGRAKKGGMLRWHENNSLALCTGPYTKNCHHWFDSNKVASVEWLKENFPEKHAWLYEDVNGKPRSAWTVKESVSDWLELEQQLKERLKELKG